MTINFNEEKYHFVWNLSSNGLFTVKSMYEDLMSDHTPFSENISGKLKFLSR
jgi:hypothetical protein